MSITPMPQRDALSSATPHQVESLTQLDALVGRHVMGCSPRVYWEYNEWRFDSLPEALEASRDPFYSAQIPEASRPRSSLREVQEFPTYSSHLGTAMSVVEHVSSEEAPLVIWRTLDGWCAGFSGRSRCEAATVPLAICLAALRSRGIRVELELPEEDGEQERCLC